MTQRRNSTQHTEESFEGPPSKGDALVVALDANLRDLAFELLAAQSFRVDAVADSVAAGKRLAKDRYKVVALETALSPLELPEGTLLIELNEGDASSRPELTARIEAALADASKDTPESDVTPPAAGP